MKAGILLQIAILVLFVSSAHAQGEKTVACTMEAKLCPDGSYVGRTGPNCEFAPCPGEEETSEEGILPNPVEPKDQAEENRDGQIGLSQNQFARALDISVNTFEFISFGILPIYRKIIIMKD